MLGIYILIGLIIIFVAGLGIALEDRINALHRHLHNMTKKLDDIKKELEK